MKKYIVAVVIIALIVLGISFAYLVPKENKTKSEKSTKEAITELLNKKYNQAANSLTVGVITDTGIFAKGTYNEPNAGGGLWFAAKTAKGWELAFDGNGIVSCSAADKYNFPKDIIPQCIDVLNGNNLIKR